MSLTDTFWVNCTLTNWFLGVRFYHFVVLSKISLSVSRHSMRTFRYFHYKSTFLDPNILSMLSVTRRPCMHIHKGSVTYNMGLMRLGWKWWYNFQPPKSSLFLNFFLSIFFSFYFSRKTRSIIWRFLFLFSFDFPKILLFLLYFQWWSNSKNGWRWCVTYRKGWMRCSWTTAPASFCRQLSAFSPAGVVWISFMSVMIW